MGIFRTIELISLGFAFMFFGLDQLEASGITVIFKPFVGLIYYPLGFFLILYGLLSFFKKPEAKEEAFKKPLNAIHS